MKVTTVRRSIIGQLEIHCRANGLTFGTTQHRGALAVMIEGDGPLSPGDAADKYLPGGFTAAFGGK